MYVLADCGLIHKYLIEKSDIKATEEETIFIVDIVKELSNFKIENKDDKLIFSNGHETFVFKKVSGSISENNKFIYFLDEFHEEEQNVNLKEYEQKYGILMDSDMPIDRRDRQLSKLMTQIEKSFKIPSINDERWNSHNKEVIELYRKISNSRSL